MSRIPFLQIAIAQPRRHRSRLHGCPPILIVAA